MSRDVFTALSIIVRVLMRTSLGRSVWRKSEQNNVNVNMAMNRPPSPSKSKQRLDLRSQRQILASWPIERLKVASLATKSCQNSNYRAKSRAEAIVGAAAYQTGQWRGQAQANHHHDLGDSQGHLGDLIFKHDSSRIVHRLLNFRMPGLLLRVVKQCRVRLWGSK